MESFGGSTITPTSHMARAMRREWVVDDDDAGAPEALPPFRAHIELDDRHDDDEEEQQFVLSVANTPATEAAPKLTPPRRLTVAECWSSAEGSRSFDDLSDATSDAAPPAVASESTTIERSQPIAIEMPNGRKSNPDPSTTPSAPLSARGDLPGGYFPRHEDPDTRVHRPHPFHADVKEARRQSIARATASSASPNSPSGSAFGSSQPHLITSSISAPAMPNAAVGASPSPAAAGLAPATDAVMDTHAHHSHSLSTDLGNIAAYNPTGAPDAMLPMGKYYPTNWENRKRQKRLLREQQQRQQLQKSPNEAKRPDDQASYQAEKDGKKRQLHKQQEELLKQALAMKPIPAPAGVPSSPSGGSSRSAAVATTTTEKPPPSGMTTRAKAPHLSHTRSDSEAKRRLQQYQRDMITQAALAANQALGGAIQQRGSDDVMRALNRIPTLRNLQLPSSPPSSSSSAAAGAAGGAAQGGHLGGAGGLAGLGGGGGVGFFQKPVSPRLQPLGSPGPVTPIDLAAIAAPEEAGGYLGIGAGGAATRPRMPLGVVTAPPGGQHGPLQGQEAAFPF